MDHFINQVIIMNSWIDTVLHFIFFTEENQYTKQVEQLIELNKIAKNNNIAGFIHMGERYGSIPAPVRGQSRQAFPSLDFSLSSEGNKLVSYRRKIESDKKQIKQLLIKLMATCESKQDVRDSIPECVIYHMKDLAILPRTRPVTWAIQHDPRALREYELIHPKIALYTVMHLLY